ncbi:MAG: ribonuclease D [Halieaceae bacterium]|jgi:ribonuclease D|nr:ribonuclease D [Halieaceae bacterium]
MNWQLIDNDAELAQVLAELEPAAEVAVDTEFMRRNTYYPQVALLQLCAGERAWLVDPLAIEDLDGLRQLMSDASTLKILHSCSEDLEVFRHWLGVLPTPLVDTQRAAALVGEPFGLGYRALVERLCGVELDKGETRSDWLRRPLSEAQCHYAALDVTELLPAWRQLRERAEARGRMDWVLEEGAAVALAMAERERELHRRVKGSGRLNARQLEVLRRLCEWREDRARETDKPRGWIVDDKLCLAIARAMPQRREDLQALELPPAVLRRQGDQLLSLVEEARAVPAHELPAPASAPLAAEDRDRLKQLRDAAKQISEAQGIAPEAGLASADLELLVREARGEAIDPPSRWDGWRRDVLLRPLRAELQRC